MAKIVVLPGGSGRGRARGDGLAIDQDVDGAQVAAEVTGVGIGLHEARRSDLRVVLCRLRRAMPEPGLQLE